MMARARLAACVAAFGLIAVPRVALAAPVIDLSWPTIPGCPDASVVRARARAAVGESKDVDDVRVVAEVTPPEHEGAPWRLHVRTRTTRAAGERTLEAPTCDAIARTAALLAAIAALRSNMPSAEHPIEELTPVPDLVEGNAAPFAPVRMPRRVSEADMHARHPSERALVASVGLGIVQGLLPLLAPAANATVGYESRRLGARIGLRAVLPQERFDRAVGAEFTAFGAGLDLCARWPFPRVLRGSAHTCGGAALDDVRARGIGGIEAFEVRRGAVMAYAGAGAVWTLGSSFRIGADVRVGGSLARPEFLIESITDGDRPLHRVAAVRSEGTLTLGVAF